MPYYLLLLVTGICPTSIGHLERVLFCFFNSRPYVRFSFGPLFDWEMPGGAVDDESFPKRKDSLSHFVLLRYAPKEKVFGQRKTRHSCDLPGVRPAKMALKERKRCVPHSRRTTSDILEEGGDDVKSAWPLWAGPHTCYNGNYNGKQGCRAELIRKDCLSSDCSLQLGNIKLKSLVIADQHAAVNMYTSPLHTARHTLLYLLVPRVRESQGDPQTRGLLLTYSCYPDRPL
ncbi:hypothetical protein ACS0TY_018982 [Phlomoides rotata]